MDVFDGDLKSIKKLRLCILDLCNKMLCKVFVYDPIACCKESQDVGDKMALAVVETLPVAKILAQIDLLCCPETGFSLLVEFPHVMMTDRKQYKTILVFSQNRFFTHGCLAHNHNRF